MTDPQVPNADDPSTSPLPFEEIGSTARPKKGTPQPEDDDSYLWGEKGAAPDEKENESSDKPATTEENT